MTVIIKVKVIKFSIIFIWNVMNDFISLQFCSIYTWPVIYDIIKIMTVLYNAKNYLSFNFNEILGWMENTSNEIYIISRWINKLLNFIPSFYIMFLCCNVYIPMACSVLMFWFRKYNLSRWRKVSKITLKLDPLLFVFCVAWLRSFH